MEAVLWGDEADGAVQTHVVVMVDELAGDAPGVLEVERGLGTDGLLFEGAMEALEFTVALRIMGRAEHMSGLPEADELYASRGRRTPSPGR